MEAPERARGKNAHKQDARPAATTLSWVTTALDRGRCTLIAAALPQRPRLQTVTRTGVYRPDVKFR